MSDIFKRIHIFGLNFKKVYILDLNFASIILNVKILIMRLVGLSFRTWNYRSYE